MKYKYEDISGHGAENKFSAVPWFVSSAKAKFEPTLYRVGRFFMLAETLSVMERDSNSFNF